MPRDPSSPTAVEQGFGQVPCPPSDLVPTVAQVQGMMLRVMVCLEEKVLVYKEFRT